MVKMDPAIIGECRIGYFRIGVLNDYWDTIVDTLEAAGGESDSLQVTRRRLILHATRDSTTGWYDKDFVESTIDMVVVPRALNHLAMRMGTYARLDAVGFTCDPILLGDEIKKNMNTFYEVKGVKEVYDTGGHFLYRECDLELVSMHDLSYSSITPTVADARSNTKDYWEAYISINNLNRHQFIVCYSDPDYPIAKVFETKGIHIVLTIDQPSSTPWLSYDLKPHSYEEHIPMHILTLDTRLEWLAEDEMRRIVKDYPEGSQRSLERRESTIHDYGPVKVYDTTFILNYVQEALQ